MPGRSVVLDGEIVATDAQGRPSFGLLQRRMHVVAPSAALLAQVPVRLYVFDLLYLDGDLLLPDPYRERRARLEALDLDGAAVTTPPVFDEGSSLADVQAASAQLGLEGVVAKRVDAPYEAGVRSRHWIKKPFNTAVEVVIGGWTPGEGRRAGTIGALLLGMYDEDGRLVYVGQVGTGFTQTDAGRPADDACATSGRRCAVRRSGAPRPRPRRPVGPARSRR